MHGTNQEVRPVGVAYLDAPEGGGGGALSGAGEERQAPPIAVPCQPSRVDWQRRQHDQRQNPVYAALDLGTNNCRLLVARPTRRGFQVIDAFSRIIRLGEGVAATRRLSDLAMGRTIEALKVCADKMVRRQVQRSRLIATEACRIADNGSEFLDRVHAETGLKLEIVDRETEARLAVSGCASLLDRDGDLALVFDIGGGSTELVWLDLKHAGKRRRRSVHDRLDMQSAVFAWTSLPVGVVTLSEHFGGRVVEPPLFEEMVGHVDGLIATFSAAHDLAHVLDGRSAHLLGTSGTVTTIAGIHLGLPAYDRRKVDGCWVDAAEVRKVSQRLLAMKHEERVAEPCIGRDRADLVLAGCAILESLMRAWPCERLRVADRGLREGILASLMAEDPIYRRRRHRPGRGD